MSFAQWKRQMLARRGLPAPDGRHLYAYRLDASEFADLRDLLRRQPVVPRQLRRWFRPDCRRYQSRKANGDHQFSYFGYSLVGERVMTTIETDHAQSGDWDPALWSIGAVLAAAIVYLAVLS